jgi:hypothetical protein
VKTRALSRTLIGGAQYRIEVGAASADAGGMVRTVELVETLGASARAGVGNAELEVLERAGRSDDGDTPEGRLAYRCC